MKERAFFLLREESATCLQESLSSILHLKQDPDYFLKDAG
jgi:hypothetical protein